MLAPIIGALGCVLGLYSLVKHAPVIGLIGTGLIFLSVSLRFV